MSEIIETTEETFEFPEIIEPVNQFYVALNEENRIIGVQSTKVNDNMFLFDFPVGFDITQHIHYKIVDGELVFDEFIYPEIEVQPTEEQLRIAELEEQQIATEISITDMDLQNIETEQAITELDLRLMVLEG